jgi:hypothetical protein
MIHTHTIIYYRRYITTAADNDLKYQIENGLYEDTLSYQNLNPISLSTKGEVIFGGIKTEF